ncbi:FAD-dependent oxidoreductase [Rhizobium rhizogenes]|uniref:FAD-dependent oxidoreductase n=1 Tax=Rhizobium rhizogenes TaxID=359 RepID=UPI0015728AD2|nr:FAD-dependent oxidoreductase [Rhizobium rhizogenes]NTF98044.1 FAD-dependent oxidoreductase [Rhizobium rhizogenes]
MATIEKVLIVGGGISGLCLAIALREQNIEVDIAEIKTEWTVYGVGIIQQSNVVRAMAELGIVDKYLAAAFPFEQPCIYAQDGSLIAKLPGLRLAGPSYPANLGVSRLALHQVLTQEAQERGARVYLGLTLKGLDQDEQGVDVAFSDGSVGRYDLVVGADGVYSKIRTLLFGDRYTPRYTGQAVWRHNFRRPKEMDHLCAFPTPNGNAGLCPLSDDLMYMFVTSSEPGNPYHREEDLPGLMRDRLKDYSGIIGELRETIHDPKEIVYRPMEVLFVEEPWYEGRVALIGDAAHATTPHLAQGAGLAIEDAVVLADELNRKPTIEAALQRFHERRYDRCKTICEGSIQVGEWELNHSPEADHKGMLVKMITLAAQAI